MKHTSLGTPGGNRLRALREYAGKTQLEVELDAGLGSGYLQRVESGKVRHPERETLERILAALGARYTERRDLLEMFGYIVSTPLPDADDIQWAISVCQSDLNSAVFPAYLLDCGHQLLAWNPLVPRLFRFDQLPRRLEAERISALRLIFDPAYRVTPRINNPDGFFHAQIRALRYERVPFQGEDWYSALIAGMRQYPIFERYWKQTETGQTFHLAARPLTPLELKSPDMGLLQFRLLSEPFAQDRRFRVLYCLPVDPSTMQHCLNGL